MKTGINATLDPLLRSSDAIEFEGALRRKIVGQDPAIDKVTEIYQMFLAGLNAPGRPVGNLLFLGPTGSGKTRVVESIAEALFGDARACIKIDCAEFQHSHEIAKLIGSPPGYVGYNEGGQLTEAVRRRPYTVVLFDEIEKAHPDVFNMLLQILEDGRLTDAKGRTVDFKNTLLIMTSNIGSKVIEKGGGSLGFEFSENQAESQYNRIRSLVNEELKQYFRPEFLNRLDEIIVFRQLNREEVKQIADIMLNEVFGRLNEQGITLEVTEAFKDRLVSEGYNPSYGARPLRRAIMRLLEDVLAEQILGGSIKEGDIAVVDVNEDGNVFVRPGEKRELLPQAAE